MKAKNESPLFFNVRGRQRLVESTVNFVFGGFGVPAETYMLKLLLFSEYIYFKSLVKFSKVSFNAACSGLSSQKTLFFDSKLKKKLFKKKANLYITDVKQLIGLFFRNSNFLQLATEFLVFCK